MRDIQLRSALAEDASTITGCARFGGPWKDGEMLSNNAFELTVNDRGCGDGQWPAAQLGR